MHRIFLSSVVVLFLNVAVSEARESWLPLSGGDQTPLLEIESLLSPLSGHSRILECQYDKALLNSLSTFGGESSSKSSDSWDCTVLTRPLSGDSRGLDLYLTFTQKQDSVHNSGVAMAFDFADWDQQNYVMIPCAVYNGNRNRIVYRDYAQGLERSDLYRKDLPQTTCEVPQLGLIPGDPSRIEVNTSNTTTPVICMYSPSKRHAFIVLAEQGIPGSDGMTDNVFFVEESSDRSRAVLGVSMPGVREMKPEFIGFSASPDRGQTFRKGDQLTMRLRIYSFPADDIPALLDKFMSVRKDVTGPNFPRKLYPMSETAKIMTRNIDRRYYDGDFKFYCPENATWISFGWIGGLMNTFPMLVLGDAEHRAKVYNTFDFAIPRAQGESGYFHGAIDQDGRNFGREGYDEFPEIALTRKNADVLFWMIKQFMVLDAQGHEVKQSWKDNVKRLADAFVETWDKHGQWGNFVNNRTGDIAVYGTTSGAMAPGGLALASVYYGEPSYLNTAFAAAREFYDNQFVPLGMTTGGCADILQNADSETAVAFMTSLMTLHEITGEQRWFEMSRNLANLCATWTVSFDYVLPMSTPLAQYGAKLTGAVWASTQNKHGAPGFCCSSADPLFKIYRATGDERYAELMRDITHAYAEGIQENGYITERLTYCDCDSRGGRSNYPGGTGWNELNGILMSQEIPGIYLRSDNGSFYVFDQVGVEIAGEDKNTITLKLDNATPYDAEVKILVENKKDLKNPVGYTSFMEWPQISVGSTQTAYYAVDRKTKKVTRVNN